MIPDVEWVGAEVWTGKVSRLEAMTFEDVFEEVIDEVIIPDLREQFDTQGRGRWPKLKDATLRRKKKLYGDRPILQATQTLYRALTVPGALHQIRQVGPDGAFFGTDLARARFHQQGKGRLPQRKIFNVTPELKRKARGKAQEKLTEMARKIVNG